MAKQSGGTLLYLAFVCFSTYCRIPKCKIGILCSHDKRLLGYDYGLRDCISAQSVINIQVAIPTANLANQEVNPTTIVCLFLKCPPLRKESWCPDTL